MQLNNIEQVTPDLISKYREELGLSLEKFWSEVGCSRSRGLRYETGHTGIPEVVKRLVFLHYGVGIPTDCRSQEFQDFMHNMRTRSINVGKVTRLIEEARELLEEQEGEGSELD